MTVLCGTVCTPEMAWSWKTTSLSRLYAVPSVHIQQAVLSYHVNLSRFHPESMAIVSQSALSGVVFTSLLPIVLSCVEISYV